MFDRTSLSLNIDFFLSNTTGYGYGCLMSELVKSWRSIWNQGTDNPFGIVTLASSGNEGGRDMGAMRWSQFGNYGVLPNKALPNTCMFTVLCLSLPRSLPLSNTNTHTQTHSRSTSVRPGRSLDEYNMLRRGMLPEQLQTQRNVRRLFGTEPVLCQPVCDKLLHGSDSSQR
jgi:hypothetical protein